MRASFTKSNVESKNNLEKSVRNAQARQSYVDYNPNKKYSSGKKSEFRSTASKEYSTELDRTPAWVETNYKGINHNISIEDGASDRFLSPTKSSAGNLVESCKDMVLDNKILEEKRKNLSLRPDFNVQEFFHMINYNKNGFLSIVEFEIFINKNQYLNLNLSDIELLFERFDRDRDGVLSFHEFWTVFAPRTKEYARNLTRRLPKGNNYFNDLTMETQKLLKDLFKSVIYIQINMEFNKQDISGGKWSQSEELFRLLDMHRDGFITYKEFEQTLIENGLCINHQDCRDLFEEFDRDANGRISFDEFHSPSKKQRDALVKTE